MKNPTEKAKPEKAKPEKVENRRAERFLARHMWTGTYRAQHPEQSDAEVKAAWDAVKTEQVKLARSGLRRLAKTGAVVVNPAPAKAKKAEAEA